MPARTRQKIELHAPTEVGELVLAAHRGRVRGEVLVRNAGTAAVTIRDLAVAGELPGARGAGSQVPVPAAWEPLEVPAADARRVAISASIDRFTPPGAYEAEVVVDGVRRRAIVQVTEEIALSVSEREIAVVASPGQEQARHLAMTNLGNVSVELARVGPVPLGEDHPRPSLLQRLGVLPLDELALVVRTERMPDARATEAEAEREAPAGAALPTVSIRLDPPVSLAPGETAVSRWLVTVDGDLRPGVRYRALAAILTADLRIVVTPALEASPAPRRTRTRRSQPSERRKT
jgi:hypothetical protein